MEIKRVFKVSGLVAVLFFVAFPLICRADVYIKQKRHTDAFEVMGQAQPEKEEITVTWMSEDKGRIDMEEGKSMIIRLDKNMMYFLDHTKMTYDEMPFGDLSEIISGAIQESDLSEEERKQAEKFMKGITGAMMKAEAEVTDTGEKQKIKSWSCRKYIMKMKMMMASSTSEIWATEDIKINYDLFRTLGSAMIAKQPGFQDVFEEMKKIKGMVVLTTSTSSAMGAEVKSTEELVEFEEKHAPPGTYEIPKGYAKSKGD
ncbi:MAG: hypothetical protein GTN73_03625 [Candidatus Aminicenantes bacterium]|nr:hypothetical protein [Candidatus Aminicenantes bacterium]